MKRSRTSSSAGIVKFFIRQNPSVQSVPEPEPITSVSEPEPSTSVSEPEPQTTVSVSTPKKIKQRSSGFNPDWKNDFPWVDEFENGMMCKLCIRHQRRPKRAQIGKATWVDVPCMWLARDSLVRHQKSETHIEAMAFEVNRTKPAQGVDTSIQTMGSLNKQARVAAFRCLYWLMKRELPHTTNYKPLLDLCIEQGVGVLNNLNNGGNDNGESQRFLQEALLTMGKLVQAPILEDLRSSPWYAIMIDETTDIAVVKEMIVYARYLKDGVSHTEFISMIPLSDGTAGSIVTALLELLTKINLPLQKMCALGSDGASVMVGKNNGVGAKLRQHVPHIISNHCVAHRLALAVGQSAKGIAYIKTFKDVLDQLHRFYKYSSVRMDGLRQIQDLYQDGVHKLSQAKDVRWLSHDQATKTLKRCLPAVITSLEREAQQRNDSQALGLSVFVQKYKFIATLGMMCDVLPHMSALSKAMQARDAVYTTVKPLVSGTIALVRQLQERPGVHFTAIQDDITALKDQGFNVSVPTEAEQTEFKKNVYDRFLQNMVENVEDRFPDLPLIENFSVFDVRGVAEDEISTHGVQELNQLAAQFSLDTTALRGQWEQVRVTLTDLDLTADQAMEWITTKLRESHPLLFKIAAVGLLLPTSTADCERGFSTLNRIKTTYRSNMSNHVLNSLIAISMQGPDVKTFDFDAAVTDWHSQKPRRTQLC